MKKMPPIIPFSIIYMLTLIAFCWWMIRFNTRRLARKEQRRIADERAALAEVIAEQERADEAARRILMLADTMPPMPALPALIQAWQLDASDTTPTTDAPVYCLACWLGDTIPEGRPWYIPAGARTFCAQHAYGTLARALSAQQQQIEHRETGEKYL